MTQQPLVTIVTPSYNQSGFLEATIQSVLAQEYPHIEYIIVDGGSTDGSLEILQRYEKRLAAWISEPDQGQTDAINKGFQLGQGEIMAWLNSDDEYYPSAIREAVAFFERNPESKMVYGDVDIINESGRVVGKFNARQASYQRLMRGYVNIPQPAAFWRRSLWETAGPLDPSLYFAMDYDLWVRFAKISDLTYLPHTWGRFRVHESGKTFLADDRCWPEMRQVFRREGGRLLSFFMFKYWIRMLLAPLWRWIKRKRLGL